jgi:hypothetical protein
VSSRVFRGIALLPSSAQTKPQNTTSSNMVPNIPSAFRLTLSNRLDKAKWTEASPFNSTINMTSSSERPEPNALSPYQVRHIEAGWVVRFCSILVKSCH